MGRLIFLTVILFMSHGVQSANILALFSSLSYSDHQVFRGYVSRLAQVGHSIVMMTAYPGHFTYPDIERIVELDVSHESVPFWNEWLKLVTNTDDYYTRLQALNEFSLKLAIAQLKSKSMQKLLQNPNAKFELVITEAEVPLLYAAADKYQAPHISITPTSGKIHQHEAKGNPIHPIQYPDVNTLNHRNLTNVQKFVEFTRHLQTKREFYYNYLPKCELAAQNIFGLTRDLQEVEYDIDLLFVTANPVLTGNRPTVPATIYTDRLHIKPGFSLPQNLKATLDAATKGVIYFSIGAVQESETLAPHLLQTLADAFRDLPFTVLWKIGNTTSFNKPDNVIAGAWFPQQEVLAHPNVKAFITHGGPRSLEEALYYEVPIVGLPIVRSRGVFMREFTKFGSGEILDPYVLNKEELKATITAVATDKKYKQAMMKVKSMAVDPILSGPESAIWWTEYVLRHGGARHLRAPTVGVGFFKYYMFDFIGIIFTGVIVGFYISLILARFIIKRFRAKFYGVGARVADAQDDRKFKAL